MSFWVHCLSTIVNGGTGMDSRETRLARKVPKPIGLSQISQIFSIFSLAQPYCPQFYQIRSRALSSRKAVAEAMTLLHSFLRALLFLTILPSSFALKFDLQAHTGHSNKYERCIRNFVAKDTLVLVTAIVDGQKGDGQMVNMHVRVLKHSLHTYGFRGEAILTLPCTADQRCGGE